MTRIKYKRRTFTDVAAEAYAKGWSQGLEQGIKEQRTKVDGMMWTNIELGRKALELENKLANVSLSQLAWSRITGLFRSRHDRVA